MNARSRLHTQALTNDESPRTTCASPPPSLSLSIYLCVCVYLCVVIFSCCCSYSEQLDKQSAMKLIQRLENDSHNAKQSMGDDTLFEVIAADAAGLDQQQQQQLGLGVDAVAQLPGQPGVEPSLEYELTRRRIHTNIAEIWSYFSSELGKLRKVVGPGNAELEESIQQVLLQGADHKRSLLSDMEQLRRVDGYEAWRQQEANELSDLVQRRLHHLQNPSDCQNARKLVCKLNKVQATTILSLRNEVPPSTSFYSLLCTLLIICSLLSVSSIISLLFSSVFIYVLIACFVISCHFVCL